MTTSDSGIQVPIVMGALYPQVWLTAKATDDPAGRTNGEIETEVSGYIVCEYWPGLVVGRRKRAANQMVTYTSD
jgi:hypothetical protein